MSPQPVAAKHGFEDGGPLKEGMCARDQESWNLLPHEEDALMTSVAVGIAKLGEPPYVASSKGGAAFTASGRALSVAAGRLSFVYGLKVGPLMLLSQKAVLCLSMTPRSRRTRW